MLLMPAEVQPHKLGMSWYNSHQLTMSWYHMYDHVMYNTPVLCRLNETVTSFDHPEIANVDPWSEVCFKAYLLS